MIKDSKDWLEWIAGTLELRPEDWAAGREAIAIARGRLKSGDVPLASCSLRAAVAAERIGEEEEWGDVRAMWMYSGHGMVKIGEDVEFKLVHSGA